MSSGEKNRNNYNPRWSRVAPKTKPYEVSGCIEPACRCTKLATKEEISQHLQCPPLDNLENMEIYRCDKHYRNLHKQLSPASYQWKCAVCSIAIRGSNYQSFRACAEPELFEKHLREHTDHDVSITASDKVCMECYRHSVKRIKKDEILEIFWDTAENIQKIKQKVRLLMNGCSCKSGCRTGRCGCKKRGAVCGAGCCCAHCENTEHIAQQEEDDVVRIER